ncbi:MAG: exosortase-associated protein EpsI, B-type [Accumulibacter sp.]|jgi:EpsI family protein
MKSLFRNLILMALMVFASGMAMALKPSKQIGNDKPKVMLEAMIPETFGGWTMDKSVTPIQPPPEQQAVIDRTYDQTLARTYVNEAGVRVMLSLAYGGNQNEGMNTHRPEICYPAQGFQLHSSMPSVLDLRQRRLPVQRVIASQGQRHEPITYWIVVGDELSAFGIKHKLSTLKYGLTGRIPDGMLIRVSTIDRDEARAFKIQELFIESLLAAVSPEDQSRLLGALPN